MCFVGFDLEGCGVVVWTGGSGGGVIGVVVGSDRVEFCVSGLLRSHDGWYLWCWLRSIDCSVA